MSKNEEKTKNKSKNDLKVKENLDIMINNNTESYKNTKQQKNKGETSGKKKNSINEELDNIDEEIPDIKIRKRSDSVNLYKKKKMEKEKRNKSIKENNKRQSSKINDIYSVSESINIKKSSMYVKNSKIKKVNFSKNFVSIIEVDSYKKYNEENTYKDPLDDLDMLRKIVNKKIKKNNNKKKKEQEQEKDDGKARANCSCLIS